ncbi:class I adenylate-forming enzyme family protein [Planktotalea sp.]|uniref:class I adenylate-forming enzyme family protein n=1 Tax=Planktotalea sp. TaxID=2029877 RepID=UPI0025F16F31|nr:class I adenylate-forming enzyme family protein [Planktotalea sp.]
MIDLSHPPCPSPFNLAQYVLAAGLKTPDKLALEVLGTTLETWTYARLTKAVLGVATGLLDAGFKPTDIVMLRLGNTADFPIAYLGAIAAGMVAVPTSSALTKSEITKMAARISPSVILQDPEITAPELADTPSIALTRLRSMYDRPAAPFHMGDPERSAYIVFTSGTSSSPRAVMHAHRAIWARRMMHNGWYDLNQNDRLLHAGAFNWTFTLGTGLMDPWTLGATALIPENATPVEKLPNLLAQHNATMFATAPGVFRKILRCDLPEFPHLRHALSAGEKMSETLHREWNAATGLKVYEAFGMSECSTFISSSPNSPTIPSSLGTPQRGRNVALLDDAGQPIQHGEIGTIAIHKSDAGLMLGYLNAPEETAAKFSGAWFLTGDQGRRDETGAIHYVGRADDMMNAGGFRVSPLEVEAAFLGEGAITQCAATEITLKDGVQVIALCYIAETDIDQSALQALATAKLARYKQPRIYHPCDTFPSSANGKLLRRVLRSQIEAHYGQA